MSGNLKWHFETTVNTLSGANDPIHETFRARPYYSIVRESIQNSMDVQRDKSKPVEVRFEIISINQAEHPELFSIRTHIESCLAFHKGNQQAENLYGGMLRYLDENPAVKILKVSDYNTEGMNYDPTNHLCPFTSFMGEGISSKSSGSGGSFGFGKGAYYVPSEIRTILVSTMVDEGKVFFQGRTRLASHKIGDDTKGKDGVFKGDGADPISSIDEIGSIFRRSEQGTDVYIVGMQHDPDCGKEMVKSVLNNFWLAVHMDRLDVVIKTDDVDVRFDETNLEEIMDEYFPDEIETGSVSDIFHWNPKAYYKSVKYAGLSDDFLIVNGNLESSLGPVRLYVYRKEGLMNRVSFMRKPAMTVYKTGRSVLSGYAATFICDNEHGNEILRQMENAAHNEWMPENVRSVSKEKKRDYVRARNDLNEFIRDTLKAISGSSNSSKMDVTGLSEYLTIPEELLDDEEPVSGESDSEAAGNASKKESENETGLTTTKNTQTTVKVKVATLDPSSAAASATLEDGDSDVETGGKPNTEEGGTEPGTGGKGQLESGSLGESGNAKSQISVGFRVAATNSPNGIIHNLIINSPKQFDGVRLVLWTGTDNGEEVELQIVESDKGKASGSMIEGVELSPGRNLVKVRFDDNLKHTLKLTAYEA